MIADTLDVPIVLAPLAGGPSTPELAAAVSEAGGLGFLAWGYLSGEAAAERLAATRELTSRPLGVNLFVPGPRSSPAVYAAYVSRISGEGALGEPRWDDDAWADKLALLEASPVAVASFTFGCPPAEAVARVQATGAEAWVTITSPGEARAAAAAGADALVVQGAEAGGHRATFDDADVVPYGLLSLLQLVRAAVDRPLVATGGIGTGEAVAAVLAAGATAAQVGTAFLRTPEAGTADAHRSALATETPTALTRAFSGRLARGVVNRFMVEHGDFAPSAYPEVHYATAPVRAAARASGDADAINLWAGEAHALARDAPAAEVLRGLAEGARAAAARAAARLGGPGRDASSA